jgi:adenylate cyclase
MKIPWVTKRSRHQVRLVRHTLIILAVGCVLALITLAQLFADLEWRLTDRLLFVSESPSPNIIIVAIDDATLEALGVRLSGEIPRSNHAQVVDNLNQAQAGAIGFDILFPQSMADDESLREAMLQAGNVVLPVAGSQPVSTEESGIVYQDILKPTSDLRQESTVTGHVNLSLDGDEVVRRLPLVVEDSTGEIYPSFSLAVLDTFFIPWSLPEDYAVQNGSLDLLGRSIPVDDASRMRINYAGSSGTFTTISYQDVLQGDFDAEQVEDKIVLIGVTATGESDFWSTPVSSARMPGVEIHASAIDTILRQRFLVETSDVLTFLIILLMTIIASLFLPRLRLRWAGLLIVGMIVVYLLAVFLAFDQGYILNPLHPPVVLAMIYVASIVCTATAEQEKRREARDLFGKYVSPQVAEEIVQLADTNSVILGGDQREATMLFADIRAFASLSEERSPESVVLLLNKYLSTVVEAILSNGGMVNKFGGDNILAVWNAPQYQEDHAFSAAKAAVEAQQAIQGMQQEEPELPDVQFGFGINTGEVLAGNVGSEGRLEYTVIGDAVNVAARLCDAAPGGQIWISSSTYEQIKVRIEAKELEPQYFKGRKGPVAVYQVLGLGLP